MTEVHFPLIARLNERDAKTQFPYEFATAYSLVHCAVAAYPVELKRGGSMVYLQISLDIAPQDRPAAAAVYHRYKGPFLAQVEGAQSKELLVRDQDVQVLHGFESVEHASAYMLSALFTQDVVTALKPLLRASPDIRIYATA
jgi:hypothetical protein